VNRRKTSTPTVYPGGSIGDLVTRYRGSDEFKRLSDGTQSNYEVTMRRFEGVDTWGLVAARDLTPLAVQTARDAMKETPVMANQMLSVGRTIWDWAIPLGLAAANPFDKVRDFDIPDRMAGLGSRIRASPCVARSRPHGTPRDYDMPTRERPDPDGARASRS
jgi:hypothetical protein